MRLSPAPAICHPALYPASQYVYPAGIQPVDRVPGVTAAAVAESGDWQHRSFVFVIAVSGADGGVKSAV